jgi:putative FmdB family regulatory protein
MPTYEYACRDCGEHLEVVQSFTDDPLRVCGACGGALRKVFSAAGIIFKGSGYYVTDSRKKSESEGGESSDKSASGSSTSESKSPESKSDSKSDSKAAPKESKSSGSSGSEAKSA